jgi:hypothetical protein
VTLAERYGERPAAALAGCLPIMRQLGAPLSGIIGNDAHTYGWHLSPARLRGTGQADDYSLRAPGDHVVDDRAASAIDIGMSWADGEATSRPGLERVRAARAAGRLPQVSELIGSPDGRRALYAAPSTSWRWEPYTGSGHIGWCHVGIYRKHANDTTFGPALFAVWTGQEEAEMATLDEILNYARGAYTHAMQGRINLRDLRTELLAEAAADKARDEALLVAVRAIGNGVDTDAIIAAINANRQAAREAAATAAAEAIRRLVDAAAETTITPEPGRD